MAKKTTSNPYKTVSIIFPNAAIESMVMGADPKTRENRLALLSKALDRDDCGITSNSSSKKKYKWDINTGSRHYNEKIEAILKTLALKAQTLCDEHEKEQMLDTAKVLTEKYNELIKAQTTEETPAPLPFNALQNKITTTEDIPDSFHGIMGHEWSEKAESLTRDIHHENAKTTSALQTGLKTGRKEEQIARKNKKDTKETKNLASDNNTIAAEPKKKTTIPLLQPELKPRNISQALLAAAIDDPEVGYAFGIGISGGGKTYMGLHKAIEHFNTHDHVHKIVLARPKRTVGDSNPGAYTGDPERKNKPYFSALNTDVLKLTGLSLDKLAKEGGPIICTTLDHDRGETFGNNIILVDEPNSFSAHEMDLILTRPGDDDNGHISKTILTGDLSKMQADIRGESPGLVHAIIQAHAYEPLRRHIAFIEFNESDGSARGRITGLMAQALRQDVDGYVRITKNIPPDLQNTLASNANIAFKYLKEGHIIAKNRYLEDVRAQNPDLFPSDNVEPLPTMANE